MTLRMFFSHEKGIEVLQRIGSYRLHSTVSKVCSPSVRVASCQTRSPSCQRAQWQRRLLPAQAVVSACLSSAHRKRRSYTSASWFCSTGQMHLLFRKSSSRNSRFRSSSQQRVYPASLASFNKPSQVRTPSVWKEAELIGTLLSVPVLKKWTSATSVKALVGTFQELPCFEGICNKTVHACGLQREQRCSTFGLCKLQRCFI